MKTLLYLVCFLSAQGGSAARSLPCAAPSLPCAARADTGVAPSATDTSKFIPVERVAEFEGTRLDDVVLEIMSKCPRWNPALKHDHTPVMAYRRQWFTLQRPD